MIKSKVALGTTAFAVGLTSLIGSMVYIDYKLENNPYKNNGIVREFDFWRKYKSQLEEERKILEDGRGLLPKEDIEVLLTRNAHSINSAEKIMLRINYSGPEIKARNDYLDKVDTIRNFLFYGEGTLLLISTALLAFGVGERKEEELFEEPFGVRRF